MNVIVNPKKDIRPLGFLISLLLSLLWFTYQQPVNHDAITYIHAAEAFLNQGLRASIHIYNWPFYPILIALISKISDLSLLNSAYLLNALFMASSLVAFVSICKNLGASKTIQMLACLTFLLYTPLGHERYMIVRDFGYYAFGLFSINFLILYQSRAKYFDLIAWSGCLIFASLFRSEGFAFLVLIPFIFFLDKSKPLATRSKDFIKANSLSLLLGFLGVIGLFFYWYHGGTIEKSLQHLLHQYWSWFQHLSANYWQKLIIIQKEIMPIYGVNQAKYYYFAGPLGFLIALSLKSIGYIYFVLCIYSYSKNIFPIKKQHHLILNTYLLINLIIVTLFAYANLFITTRYLMFMALIWMIRVPFAMHAIYQRFPGKFLQPRTWHWQPSLLNIGILILCISTLFHFGANRSYYLTTQHWVQKNIHSKQSILLNSDILSFYINHPGKTDKKLINAMKMRPKAALKLIERFPYTIIEASNRKTQQVQNFIRHNQLSIIKIFHNNHNDKIYILSNKLKTRNSTALFIRAAQNE